MSAIQPPRSKSAASSRQSAQKPRKSSNVGIKPIEKDGGKVVGQYKLGKTLGEGTFGKVRLAIHIPTGEKVAVKVLEKSRIKDQADVRRVNREIKILKKARHSNIIQLYEVLDTTDTIYLMMENADGGEMFDYIVSHRYVQERQACKFFHQLVDGVDVLHRAEITHRDLKPENLLLKATPTGWILKIVDFGLSNTHEGGRLLSTACGSPCYAAPEMIAGKQYEGPLADIWSLGVILFALVCGFLPFEDANTAILYRKILAGDYKPAKWISPEVSDLIRRILETDPRKRYRFDDVRRHPWYCQVSDEEVPREYVSRNDSDQARAETFRQLEEAGVNMQAVRDGLASRTCNSVTAHYYLLESKIRNQMALNSQAPRDPETAAAVAAASAAERPETSNASGVSVVGQERERPRTSAPPTADYRPVVETTRNQPITAQPTNPAGNGGLPAVSTNPVKTGPPSQPIQAFAQRPQSVVASSPGVTTNSVPQQRTVAPNLPTATSVPVQQPVSVTATGPRSTSEVAATVVATEVDKSGRQAVPVPGVAYKRVQYTAQTGGAAPASQSSRNEPGGTPPVGSYFENVNTGAVRPDSRRTKSRAGNAPTTPAIGNPADLTPSGPQAPVDRPRSSSASNAGRRGRNIVTDSSESAGTAEVRAPESASSGKKPFLPSGSNNVPVSKAPPRGGPTPVSDATRPAQPTGTNTSSSQPVSTQPMGIVPGPPSMVSTAQSVPAQSQVAGTAPSRSTAGTTEAQNSSALNRTLNFMQVHNLAPMSSRQAAPIRSAFSFQ